MEKLISLFISDSSTSRKRRREPMVPSYDLPLLHENRRIVIPPKPPHMSGRSIAPNFSGVLKNKDENCDMSNILFGEPIPDQQSFAVPSTGTRYPTMALFK